MAWKGCPNCHCEERSNVAILRRNHGEHTSLQPKIATTDAQPFTMKERCERGIPLADASTPFGDALRHCLKGVLVKIVLIRSVFAHSNVMSSTTGL